MDDDLTQLEEVFIIAEKNGKSWKAPGEAQFYGDSLMRWNLRMEDLSCVFQKVVRKNPFPNIP